MNTPSRSKLKIRNDDHKLKMSLSFEDMSLLVSFPVNNHETTENVNINTAVVQYRRESPVIVIGDKIHGISIPGSLKPLKHIIRGSCTFYVGCTYIYNRRVIPISFSLYVHPKQFLHGIEQEFLPEELNVLKLLKLSMKSSAGSTEGKILLDTEYEKRYPKRNSSNRVLSNDAHWNKKYKLMTHQQTSLRWMMTIENHIRNHKNIIRTCTNSVPIANTGYFYSKHDNAFVKDLPQDFSDIYYHGGILCNSVGSGKTAIILALITRTLKQRIPPTAVSFSKRQNLIFSNGTLIVTSYNLPRHWSREINKFLSGLSVITILDYKDFTKFTQENIEEANIILTTSHFLQSKKYQASVIKQYSSLLGTKVRDVNWGTIYASSRCAKNRNGFFHEFGIPLQSFLFKRIVVDDIHNSFILKSVEYLSGLCNWGLTGFPNVEINGYLREYCKLVNFNVKRWTPNVCYQFVKTCMYRDVVETGGDIQHDIRKIQLSDTEISILNSYSDSPIEKQIRICSYFNSVFMVDSRGRSMDPIRLCNIKDIVKNVQTSIGLKLNRLKDTVRGKNNSLKQLKRRVAQTEAELTVQYTELDQVDESREDIIQELNLTINKIEEKLYMFRCKVDKVQQAIDVKQTKIENLKRQLEHFTQRLYNYDIVNDETECPICYASKATVITPCGHMYCRPCIKKCLLNNEHCPICKTSIKEKEIHEIKEFYTEDDDNSKRYGSKMAEIITLVHDIISKKEQCVIFVQWFSLMRCLKTILQDQNIKVSCISGNTACRQSSLERFDTGDTNALLICLDHPSSGLNLVKANHIIFAHALCGKPEETQPLIDKAISRVYRTSQEKTVFVHWFITNETVEDKIFKKYKLQS